jgi:hypothetical protein
MKIDFKIVLILLIFLSGCQTEIDINNIIEEGSPLILTLRTSEDDTSKISFFQIDTIKTNSEKWNKLEEFASNNISGWKSSPASYNSDFYLTQKEFRLLGWKKGNGVVIGFTDINGKSVQYSREIKPGELDFLIE